MKKKNSLVFYFLAIVSSLCIICIVFIVAMQWSERKPDYMSEFGGNPEVYARIQSLSDCAALQSEFDQAESNLQEPGTPQYRWGLGYMKASDDRMREIGCYESNQMPIEQIIANTSAAAQTQTMAFASTIASSTPLPSAFIQPTLAPTWTPAPTATLYVLTLVTLPVSDAGSQCVCDQDVYNCGDALEQVCFAACNAQGAGDIHHLDNNNNGIACDNP